MVELVSATAVCYCYLLIDGPKQTYTVIQWLNRSVSRKRYIIQFLKNHASKAVLLVDSGTCSLVKTYFCICTFMALTSLQKIYCLMTS